MRLHSPSITGSLTLSGSAVTTGFVGIGTTDPSTMLHLKSSTGSTPKITIEDTNADDNFGALQFIKDSASPGTGDKLMQIWAYGDNNNAEQILYSEIATLPTSVADGSEEGSMRFRVMNAGSFVETMRIRGAKVGIGIIPVATFQAKMASNVNFTLSANSSDLRINAVNDAVDTAIGLEFNASAYEFLGNGDVVFSGANNKISGSATSTGSFGAGYIDNKLGINTASPSAKLEIVNGVGNGTAYDVIKIDADSGNFGGQWITNTWGNGQQGRIGFYGTGTTSATRGTALIGGAGTVPQLFVNGSGKVGIGTVSPTSLLTVSGSGAELRVHSSDENVNQSLIKIGSDLHASNSKDAWMFFLTGQGTGDRTMAIGNTHDGKFKVSYLGDRTTAPTGGDEIFTVDGQNSRVGIGTTSPEVALDVVGDVKIKGDLTAETLIISSSVTNLTTQFASGSTRFGDTLDDTHEFTGSLNVSGSVHTLGGGNIDLRANNVNLDWMHADADQVLRIEIDGGNDAYFSVTGNNDYYFRTNSSTGLKISGTQVVTAGGTTAAANSVKFGVVGNINIGNGQSSAVAYFENSGTDAYIEGAGSKLNLGIVGQTQVVTIDGGGSITATGNVSGSVSSTGSFGAGYIDNKLGIGTVSPTAPIHIQHSVLSGFDSHADDLLVIERTGGVTSFNMAVDTDQTSYLMFSDTTRNVGSIAYFHDGDNMVFRVGAGTRFQLDSNSRISLSNNDAGGTGGQNSTTGNTIFGYKAGNAISSADVNNTLIGHNAGLVINAGEANSIIGTNAGDALTSGDLNTAFGYFALSTSTDVDRVVAIGAGAMESGNATSDADGTVAIGSNALLALTSGQKNTAVGFESLKSNTIGDNNTSVGYQALESFNADTDEHGNNTAVGHNTMQGNVTGTDNTAIGNQSAFSGTNNMTSGDNNTFIGSKSTPSSATPTNQTVIGYNAVGQADNSVTLGDSTVTDVYMAQDGDANVNCGHILSTLDDRVNAPGSGTGATVGMHISSSGVPYIRFTETNAAASGIADFEIYAGNGQYVLFDVADGAAVYTANTSQVISGDFNDTSDIGFKENIVSIDDGLSIISKLNPVTFDWKNKSKGTNSGFIAQEVEKILPNDVNGTDYDESLKDLPPTEVDNSGKSINLSGIVAHLTKAVQELSEKVESQQKEIEELKGK